jgi:hypothetical protein
MGTDCACALEHLEPPVDEAVISDLISEASCRAQLEQHEEAKEVRTRDDARAPSRASKMVSPIVS